MNTNFFDIDMLLIGTTRLNTLYGCHNTPIFLGYGKPKLAIIVRNSCFGFVRRRLCCFSSPTVLLVRPAFMLDTVITLQS